VTVDRALTLLVLAAGLVALCWVDLHFVFDVV
jgi:hypothetical protein